MKVMISEAGAQLLDETLFSDSATHANESVSISLNSIKNVGTGLFIDDSVAHPGG
jgi:hypothetical protein